MEKWFALSNPESAEHKGWKLNWIRADLWLFAGLSLGAVAYFSNESLPVGYCNISTVPVGVALGRGAKLWARRGGRHGSSPSAIEFLIVLLLLWLLAGSFETGGLDKAVYYRGRLRWCGPWENPNISGLLMALGVVLAVGLAVYIAMDTFSPRRAARRCLWPKLIFYFGAAAAMSIRLAATYSRGAWLAASCGVLYLCIFAARSRFSEEKYEFHRITRHVFSLMMIVCALSVLAFWQFRNSEWAMIQRVFSVSNINDRSWRNRVIAWDGALQMIAGTPLFGSGWNRPGQVYDSYYRPSKLDEGTAIQLNDYLMLGAAIGVGPLLCFLIYVWRSLTFDPEDLVTDNSKCPGVSDGPDRHHTVRVPSLILKRVCRGAVVALLVGFCFDGGLFRWELGIPFWILLELGR